MWPPVSTASRNRHRRGAAETFVAGWPGRLLDLGRIARELCNATQCTWSDMNTCCLCTDPAPGTAVPSIATTIACQIVRHATGPPTKKTSDGSGGCLHHVG